MEGKIRIAGTVGESIVDGPGFRYTTEFEQLLELSDPFAEKKLLGQLDLLVDGPFIMAEKNIELRFRGSANQRVLDVPKSLEANEAVWAEQYR